jgi:hypothetical protein
VGGGEGQCFAGVGTPKPAPLEKLGAANPVCLAPWEIAGPQEEDGAMEIQRWLCRLLAFWGADLLERSGHQGIEG